LVGVGIADNLTAGCCVYRGEEAGGSTVKDVDADFASFVLANEQALLRFAWLLMADRHAAEDLVQTALEKTMPKWNSIRHDDPMAYLHRVMVNTRTSWWRRHRGRESVTDDVKDVAVDDASDSFADRDQLTTALRLLTEGQRKVVVLRHYQDLSEAQTAEILGCSTGTVKSQNARALARLRASLRQPAGSATPNDRPVVNRYQGTTRHDVCESVRLGQGMEGS
jgi:RNA polymerase sigma-70 factor (sigma-E family)